MRSPSSVVASTPAWLVRVEATVLCTDPVMALTGRRATPAKLQAIGCRFEHQDLREAVRELIAVG